MLDRVRRQTGGVVVRRVRDLDALARELEAAEPRTSAMLGDLFGYATGGGPGRGRSRGRAVVRDVVVDGRRVGTVLLTRRAFDLWFASVLLIDPAHAAAVARVVDRSPAVALNGGADDVAPLLAHLTRLQFANQLPWVVSEYPHSVFDTPTDGTRLATLRDLDALVRLYADYEYGYERTTSQLRTTLERLVREQFVVIAEDAGELVAAAYVLTRTARYLVADGLTVRPDRRGEAWMWHICGRFQELANALALSVIVFLAPSNPVVVDDLTLAEHWVTARLWPQRRFRGHNRLRDLLVARDPRRHRDPELFRNPTDPTDRRVEATRRDAAGRISRASRRPSNGG